MRTMIEIDRDHAVYEAAATDNNRLVLTGVLFTNRDGGRAVATDGKIAAIVLAKTEGLADDVIVPATFLKAAYRATKSNRVQFIVDSEAQRAFTVDGKLSEHLIQGSFPDVWRLIPDVDAEYCTRYLNLNFSLGVRLSKAIGSYVDKEARLKLCPTGAASPILAVAAGAIGLYMPIVAVVPSDEEIRETVAKLNGAVSVA